jgi:2,4-didehydro-3-deoxy-L-rhamnonate hydrolase
VIGSRGRHIDEADAFSHVARYTVGQDISDRLEQFRALRQFTMGKSFETYAPIGPVLVTPDEIPDPNDLDVRCWLDGEEVQNGNTSDWIFTIPQIISWVSQVCTVEAGDLIFTGTPFGVGYIRDPPRFLAPGMLLETEIAEIGRMANRCVAGEPYRMIVKRSA